MIDAQGQLPRIFQANIARLYQRVILPGVRALPVHDRLETSEASSMEQFLDRASAQVDNYTANEANKVYVLVLIALFERQLRIWAQHILDAAEGPKIPTMRFQVLLGTLAERQGIDVAAHALGINLVEAFLVGNVVRHGDGPSSAALSAQASMMWDRSQGDYFDILTPDSPGSE